MRWSLWLVTCAAIIACSAELTLAVAADEESGYAWAAPMKKVNAGHRGKRYVLQLGDSITYSMAFWAPLDYVNPVPFLPLNARPKSPLGSSWKAVLGGVRDKGPEHGNFSGWTVGHLAKGIDKWLADKQPDAAILMIGTNDIAGGKVPDDYEAKLNEVIEKCLAAHCIPILNTIPPRRDRDAAVAKLNGLVYAAAKKHDVPLVDYHAEIIKRSPDGKWDGTLISADGVHPSGGKVDDFSEENLSKSGYALRTWLNFVMYREVYFRALKPVSVSQ